MSKERKKLIKKLDDVFSLYVRERDNYKCITCGVDKNTHVIQCGHLFSRISHSTRWSEKNAFAQCSGCNMKHEHDFEPYRRAWLEKYSQEEYDILYAKFSGTTKYNDIDLKYLIFYYQRKTEKIKDGKNRKGWDFGRS